MELLDIIDSSGNPLHYASPRDMVHKNGDWHRTVHVWIINAASEILLQKRAAAKETFPGLWDISCAGHLQAGETSVMGAIKEVREELGITVTEKDLRFLFTIQGSHVAANGAIVDNEISDVYLVQKDLLLSDIMIQPEELSAVKWITVDDFKKELAANPQDYVPHKEAYGYLFNFLERVR